MNQPIGNLQQTYRILDVTAGNRAMYKGNHDSNTLFIDRRRCVKPDIVAVWAYLPIKDEAVEGGVIDPPHMLYVSAGKPMGFGFIEKYDVLNRETWREDLRAAFDELMRVIVTDGLLLVKWNDNHVSLERFLACFPIPPFSKASMAASRGVRRKGSVEPRSQTWYLLFSRNGEVYA